MTERKVVPCYARIEQDTRITNDDVLAEMKDCPDAYVLIHTDEGVIWGKIDDAGEPILYSMTAENTLEQIELWHQLRLFTPTYEVHLWRDGDKRWHKRALRDLESPEGANLYDMLDEDYLLWGNRAQDQGGGFTRLFDASQGLSHTIPLSYKHVAPYIDEGRGVTLQVRHYLEELQETGALRIAASRLVAFNVYSQLPEGDAS